MIEEQIIRQLIELNQRVEGMAIPEKSPDPISPFQDLPGLVGFWPMSSVQRSTGDAYDLSGQGRTLSYNGNPTYNIFNNLVPYLQLDGTGDFLSRADETDLDVQGNETHNATAVLGMAAGGWFRVDSFVAATAKGLITKSDAVAANSSFQLYVFDSGRIQFDISTGAAFIQALASDGTVSTGTWFNVVCTFDPSTRMDIYINGVSVANQTVAVPATIPNTARAFLIGGFDGGAALLDGGVTKCFYGANLISSVLVSSFFQQTRSLFGV